MTPVEKNNVVKYKLDGDHFLWGTKRYFGCTSLSEEYERSIVSVSFPMHSSEGFHSNFFNAFKVNPPTPGEIVLSDDKNYEILWLATDLFFVYFKSKSQFPEKEVSELLDGVAYVTDQTHNWCQLRLDGKLVLPALERICPLDLNLEKFPIGGCCRTIMEHINTILIRRNQDEFLLLSPSSSAHSFFEVVEQSFLNVSD